MREHFLTAALVVLALLLLAAAVCAVRGPRFTDRIVAVNLISTLAVGMMCLLSLLLKEDFLSDVALLYALVSFVTIAVLCKLVIRRRREQMRREKVTEHRTHGEETP